jgi:2-(1,2-epoxy-1,2-dihydrophenyl)acetyl-CoA isomerase
MERVAIERAGGILTLKLNRPEKVNALDTATTAELIEALREAENDASVRVLILTGAGRGFSAGQDLGEYAMARQLQPGFSIRDHLRGGYNLVTTLLRRIEKPVIAAMNGISAGVGLSLALACDLRFAADDASFTLGFSRIGLIPDGGASLLLPKLVGLGRAYALAYSSDKIDAAAALEIGLIDRVVPAAVLLEDTIAFARELEARPARSLALIKRAFNRAVLPQLDDWLEEEADLQEQAARSSDHLEGIAAFLEKRAPRFTGGD